MDFKNAWDSFMREILYKILSEFGMPMGLVVMILKIYLNETCSEVLTNDYISY
jgi:hypothetical protein